MDKVYLLLMTVAVISFGVQAFSGTRRDGSGRKRVNLDLLALGLLFWSLVIWIQLARNAF